MPASESWNSRVAPFDGIMPWGRKIIVRMSSAPRYM